MEIKGTFKTIDNETIQVRIWSLEGDFTYDIDTATDKAIYFDVNPIEIESNCDDAFSELIIKNCSVNLMTNKYLGDYLFSTGLTDIKVEIKNLSRGNYIFCGFVEPEIYTQGYAYEYEQLSINCLDALGILQYIPYFHTATSNSYNDYKNSHKIMLFKDIIEHIFEDANVYIEDNEAKPISWLYLGSTNSNTMNVHSELSNYSINEVLFLGDDESDCMTKEDVLKEILKYFNLHAVQEGEYIYFFNRDIFRYSGSVKSYGYYDLGQSGNASNIVRHITLTGDDYASDDTNISTCEVYNQIQLKADRDVIDDVIVSPLESDYMTSPFKTRRYYSMVWWYDNDYNYEHWFLRYKESTNWWFNTNWTYNKTDELGIARTFKSNNFTTSLLSLGNLTTAQQADGWGPGFYIDNVKGTPSMSDYLVISINQNSDETSLGSIVNDATTEEELIASDGLAKYTNRTNGFYSPSDDDIINYIVISGSVLYQHYELEKERYWGNVQYSILNNTGFVNFITPERTMIMPPTSKAKKTFKYQKTQIKGGDSTDLTTYDKVTKLPVLRCMLRIGDKYLKELFTPTYRVRNGASDFEEWLTFNYEWTTTPSTFSISVNPNVGDYIIGDKLDLTNEISSTMNIDAEGMAIPILKSDNLHGDVEFKILGPYNPVWTEEKVKVSGWWFWKKTDNQSSDYNILDYTSNIFIDNFEIKFCTDNGKINLLNESDVIYYSDENIKYKNKKDDITFKINSGLTLEESETMNINNLVALNNPIYNSQVATSLINGIKPEHAYIDYYYNEYNKPKLLIQTTLRNLSNMMDDGDLTTLTAMTPHLKTWTVGNYFIDKKFYTLSASYNVRNNTSNILLKEL